MEEVVKLASPVESILKKMILSEKDLEYYKNQNVLLTCERDGCTRINNCSCDCNDGSGW